MMEMEMIENILIIFINEKNKECFWNWIHSVYKEEGNLTGEDRN